MRNKTTTKTTTNTATTTSSSSSSENDLNIGPDDKTKNHGDGTYNNMVPSHQQQLQSRLPKEQQETKRSY